MIFTAKADDDDAIKNFIYSKVREICEVGCLLYLGRPVASCEMIAAELHKAGFINESNTGISNYVTDNLLRQLVREGWLDKWETQEVKGRLYYTPVSALDKIARAIG